MKPSSEPVFLFFNRMMYASELSIFPKLNLIACLTEDLLSTLPETADMGETLAPALLGIVLLKILLPLQQLHH